MPENDETTTTRTPRPGSAYTPPPWLIALRRVHVIPFHDGEPSDLPEPEEMTAEDDPGLDWDGADDEDPDQLARTPELRNHLLYLGVLALADLHRQGSETNRLLRSIGGALRQNRKLGQAQVEQLDELLDLFSGLQGGEQDSGDDDGEQGTSDPDDGEQGTSDPDDGGADTEPTRDETDRAAERNERDGGDDGGGDAPATSTRLPPAAQEHFSHPIPEEDVDENE